MCINKQFPKNMMCENIYILRLNRVSNSITFVVLQTLSSTEHEFHTSKIRVSFSASALIFCSLLIVLHTTYFLYNYNLCDQWDIDTPKEILKLVKELSQIFISTSRLHLIHLLLFYNLLNLSYVSTWWSSLTSDNASLDCIFNKLGFASACLFLQFNFVSCMTHICKHPCGILVLVGVFATSKYILVYVIIVCCCTPIRDVCYPFKGCLNCV